MRRICLQRLHFGQGQTGALLNLLIGEHAQLEEVGGRCVTAPVRAALCVNPALRIRWVAMARCTMASTRPIDGFADGRGFSLIRELRLLGFKGTLRAAGNILPDQYAMLRRLGADEVLISERWAARHRQEYWLARANWRRHHYQGRLESQGY